MARHRDRPTVEVLARQVNRAIFRDWQGIYARAGIRPLGYVLIPRPVDVANPDGPRVPMTRQTGGPNRADRRFIEGKHARKAEHRAALEATARIAAKAADA